MRDCSSVRDRAGPWVRPTLDTQSPQDVLVRRDDRSVMDPRANMWVGVARPVLQCAQ
jgi:hypothetical protein